MTVALILLVLAVIAVLVIVAANRSTRARPDRPLEGAELDGQDTPDIDDAADDRVAWSSDRPGDAGSEDMNSAEPGDTSPGPPGRGDRT